MTAHRDKPTLTPDRVRWFADYHRRHPAWGIFHVALSDGNYEFGAAKEALARDAWTAEEREAAAWFDALTPSQRRRLGQRAEDAANTIVPRSAP